MFTSQHYKAVSEILRKNHDRSLDRSNQITVELVAIDLALMFMRDNPNFDNEVFLEACGNKSELKSIKHKTSPRAAKTLLEQIDSDTPSADRLMGDTDCPEGCEVEPDGHCSHGYESAALTLGVI